MEYDFRVTQPALTFFEGQISINAKSKKEAISKLKKLTNSEIDGLCTDWELSDNGADADGNIEIWDDNGKQLI